MTLLAPTTPTDDPLTGPAPGFNGGSFPDDVAARDATTQTQPCPAQTDSPPLDPRAFNKMLVAVDSDDPEAPELVRKAVDAASPNATKLKFIAINRPRLAPAMPETMPVGAVTSARGHAAEAHKKRRRRKWRALGELVRPFAGKHDVELEVGFGEPSEQIVRAAKDWKADMVVMGARKRSWWRRLLPSTAGDVTRDAPCPVLVVPVKWAA